MTRNWLYITLIALTIPVHAKDSHVRFANTVVNVPAKQDGFMRTDPSDIIRVNGVYYIWYTKGRQESRYDATIFYAASFDGENWTEQGQAIARGPKDTWDEQSVFAPNILIANGKYWLYYTAVPKPFTNKGNKVTKSAIGVASSDSPDGPWTKFKSNPVLLPSDNPADFDSMRVDNACLIIRQGKIWLYYKGRQWESVPHSTKTGVAIADKPTGPYTKHKNNPVINGGNEVVVWPYGDGVIAMLNDVAPEDLKNTLQYAPDGLSFNTYMYYAPHIPNAAGTFRPEASTDSGKGKMPKWGVCINKKPDTLPPIKRFNIVQWP